tara:strand:- start:2867 stop:3088 length:222 start_codon:yes stop_codon:yes gene_type:complete
MKTWCYAEPVYDANGKIIDDKVLEITEAQILESYYPFWSDTMRDLGREDKISDQNCIDDFVTVNWCWEKKESE